MKRIQKVLAAGFMLLAIAGCGQLKGSCEAEPADPLVKVAGVSNDSPMCADVGDYNCRRVDDYLNRLKRRLGRINSCHQDEPVAETVTASDSADGIGLPEVLPESVAMEQEKGAVIKDPDFVKTAGSFIYILKLDSDGLRQDRSRLDSL